MPLLFALPRRLVYLRLARSIAPGPEGPSAFIFFDWPKKTEPEKRPACAWPAYGGCPALLGIVGPALMGHPWPSKAFAASMPLNPTIPAMLGHAKALVDQKQKACAMRTQDSRPVASFSWPHCVAEHRSHFSSVAPWMARRAANDMDVDRRGREIARSAGHRPQAGHALGCAFSLVTFSLLTQRESDAAWLQARIYCASAQI